MRIKVTEKSLQAGREASDKMKERIGEMNLFLSKFDSEFWKMVSADLDTRIDLTTSARDNNCAKMSHEELLSNAVEERTLRLMKNLPARVVVARDQLMKDHTSLVQDIHARASRIKE